MGASLKEKAILLISENLGEIVAASYRKFCSDKSEEVVIDSVTEILTEVLGESKAKEKIKTLRV